MGIDRKRLGQNIRRARERAGLSVNQACRAAGIPRSTWNAYQSGAAEPSLGRLASIARVLGTTVSALTKGIDA